MRFTKKNEGLHPFENPASLEFFSDKNDTSLVAFGSHSKKRPHALTLVRMFEHRVLDMLELLVVPETLRTLSQFKNARKPGLGLQPLVCFAGTPFENPAGSRYTLAKSLFLDLFKKGPASDTKGGTVDVEGLQYVVCISAGDEVDGQPPPPIHLRCYLTRTKRSGVQGSRLPKVEVEEMGPRVDFRLGRERQADQDMWKQAMKRPKGTEPKAKKNLETDAMGDKLARIHVGKQNLDKLQTRKMKGLKRNRDDVQTDGHNVPGGSQMDTEDHLKKARKE